MGLRRCSLALVIALAAVGASATPANAGTAFVQNGRVTFAAGPGEVNQVELSYHYGGFYAVEDQISPLTAGAGCFQLSGHLVRCESNSPTAIVALGDLDDSFSPDSTPTTDSPGSFACVCNGGPGTDQLTGGTRGDDLDGGEGTDTLTGGLLADKFTGGPGTDTVSYADHPNRVVAKIGLSGGNDTDGPGGDSIGSTVENLRGGDGNDTLVGSTAANTLAGGNGNDELDGGTGPDDLHGESGTDTATYAPRTLGVTADLDGLANDGNADDGPPGARDRIRTDVENLTGGSGGDTLTGANSGINTLLGGDGPDTLNGLGNPDTLDGGAGPDSLAGGADVDTVTYANRGAPVTVTIGNGLADDGNGSDGPVGARDNVQGDVENLIGGADGDTLTGSGANNDLAGRNGNDTLRGGANADVLHGDAGNDELRGEPGTDTLEGGIGADAMSGGADVDTVTYADHASFVKANLDGLQNDGGPEDGSGDRIAADVENLTGGPGGDQLTGSAGPNTLLGGPGFDALDGGDGPDTLNGQQEDDVLRGGLAADALIGGSGDHDQASYAERGASVIASPDGTPNSGGGLDGPAGARDTIATDVEDLTGGGGNDTLNGDGRANGLDGGPGDDTLNGGGDSDRLRGGTGADDLVGGPGGDQADYAERFTHLTVTIDGVANDGAAEDESFGRRDNVTTTTEGVIGGGGDDSLTGNNNAESFEGGDGVDTISGVGGADFISGGDGNDILTGTPGRDSISGGDGNDTLEGLGKSDSLEGDAGDDTLRGGDQNDQLNGGADDDLLIGGFQADNMQGGSGFDVVSYEDRGVGVRVDFDEFFGQGSYEDNLQGEERDGGHDGIAGDIEGITGGAGEDQLFGDDDDNRITGGLGPDNLQGRGGNDDMQARDGVADFVDCGDGVDTATVDALDTVTADCETIDVG